MNYKKRIIPGVVIWLVAFVAASVFIASDSSDVLVARLVVPIMAGVAAFWAGKMLKQPSAGTMIKYSFGWVIIALVLDLIIAVPFGGWEIFAQWNVWLGYVLILVTPLVATRKA